MSDGWLAVLQTAFGFGGYPGRRRKADLPWAECSQAVGLKTAKSKQISTNKCDAHPIRGSGCIYGCVTTGEVWQFLQLVDHRVTLHSTRIYVDNVGLLLAAFAAAVGE